MNTQSKITRACSLHDCCPFPQPRSESPEPMVLLLCPLVAGVWASATLKDWWFRRDSSCTSLLCYRSRYILVRCTRSTRCETSGTSSLPLTRSTACIDESKRSRQSTRLCTCFLEGWRVRLWEEGTLTWWAAQVPILHFLIKCSCIHSVSGKIGIKWENHTSARLSALPVQSLDGSYFSKPLS